MCLDKFIKKNNDLGLLILRLSLALLFIYGGVGKLFGILGGPGLSAFSGMVWGQMWLAVLVAIVELVAGVALLVGIWSRESAFALAIVIVVAILHVHLPKLITNGPGQFALMNVFIHIVILASLIQIIYSGSGKIALKKD